MLSPFRLSYVCRLSVTFVHTSQTVEMFGNISSHLVPWPPADIDDCRLYLIEASIARSIVRGLKARGVAKYNDFGIWNAVSPKWCKIEGKLVLITNTVCFKKRHCFGLLQFPRTSTDFDNFWQICC